MDEQEDGCKGRESWAFQYRPGTLSEAQVGALRALEPLAPKWFCWGGKWLKDGKPKAPGNPNNMKFGYPENMGTAASLETAISKLKGDRVAGVGLALNAADSRLAVLDLDHVRNPKTGELCTVGAQALALLKGHYVETSPSGSGLRAVILCDGLEGKKLVLNLGAPGADGNPCKVEVFSGGHNSYTRMTGELVPGHGVARVGDGAAVMAWVRSLKASTEATPTSPTKSMPAGNVWDKLAHYRGDDEDKHPDEVVGALKLAARRKPSGPVAQVLDQLQTGKTDSEGEFLLACEAIRKGAGNADDAGEVLLILAGNGARPKLKDRKDYRSRTAETAAQRVLKQIESGGTQYLSPSTWKNLPRAEVANKEPARVVMSDSEVETMQATGEEFVMGKSGQPIPCAANAELALRIGETTAGMLRFNTWSLEVECARPIQSLHLSASTQLGKLPEADYLFIGKHLLTRWHMNLDKHEVQDAVLMAAHAVKYDPLREALEGLPVWDGIARVGGSGPGWLVTHAKVDNAGMEEYVRAVGSCFLVASVKRIMHPGCKMDEVLCLEGAKGGGKSTLFEVLADALLPGSFTDQVHDFTDPKHRIEATESKFVVELSELAAVKRAKDQEALKAALSAKSDSARRAYARSNVEVPRRFVVVATTNQSEYIADPTGALARRFWTVKTLSSETNQIDMGKLREDAPQLWAEALHLHELGAQTFIKEGSEAFAQWVGERDKRQEAAPYAEEVAVALHKIATGHRDAADAYHYEKGIRSATVATLGGIDPEKWATDPVLKRRFGDAMTQAGFVKGGTYGGHLHWKVSPEVLGGVPRQ